MVIVKLIDQIIAATAFMKERPDLLQFQMLHSDKLSKPELQAVVDYLLANGAEWSDDKDNYEHSHIMDTFHLWLGMREMPRLRLYCGFQYLGKPEKNYAFKKYAERVLVPTEAPAAS